MHTQYVFKLKFSVDKIINPNWKKPFFEYFFVKNYDTRPEWEEIINPNFLDLLETTMPIARLMVFNKPKNWSTTDAHIDPGVLFALNIVPNVSNAKMQWFKAISSEKKEISYSKANTPYLNYQEKELALIHEASIDNRISIVRTDVPHRIKIGNSSRTCISFRFKCNFKSWDEVYNFYDCLGWVDIE